MIDKTREYTTRNGKAVRIYTIDGGGTFPIHGAWLNCEGHWVPETWTVKGNVYHNNTIISPLDLIEKPKIIKGWINIYQENTSGVYATKSSASICSNPGRIACIQVEFKEGEGL